MDMCSQGEDSLIGVNRSRRSFRLTGQNLKKPLFLRRKRVNEIREKGGLLPDLCVTVPGPPLKWAKGIEWTKVISAVWKGFEIKRIREEQAEGKRGASISGRRSTEPLP